MKLETIREKYLRRS